MLNLAASKALTLGAVLQVCKEGHNTKRQYIYFKKMNKSYNHPRLGIGNQIFFLISTTIKLLLVKFLQNPALQMGLRLFRKELPAATELRTIHLFWLHEWPPRQKETELI